MTGCKIDPFTFKQVVTAVRHYLKPEGKPTGLGRKAKVIFDRLLPDLDRAIRRSETARAAARRRKEAAKKIAEAETKTETQAETGAESTIQVQQPADSETGKYQPSVISPAEHTSNRVTAKNRYRNSASQMHIPLNQS
jgi:hypothetical protein